MENFYVNISCLADDPKENKIVNEQEQNNPVNPSDQTEETQSYTETNNSAAKESEEVINEEGDDELAESEPAPEKKK